MAEYDCIVVGGGLSGLAAAVRLAHFGQRVGIFEAHRVTGGLNSWYRRNGRQIDTGLHALTNYVPPEMRNAPLNRILRQLRISRKELELEPQRFSEIRFPGTSLVLDNDFAHFTARVRELFPEDAQGFAALAERIAKCAYSGEIQKRRSTLEVLKEHISSRRLRDMLCMPVMFYGNPEEDDMDFQSFATMFQSVMAEGFARPRHGMQGVLAVLERRLREGGAELFTNCRVEKIIVENGRAAGVVDAHNAVHRASCIISTVGAVETAALCCGTGTAAPDDIPVMNCRPGKVGFVEAVYALDAPAAQYGLEAAVTFWCRQDEFTFHAGQQQTVADSALLVCAPGNYPGCTGEEAQLLRLSALTAPGLWLDPSVPEDVYTGNKKAAAQMLQQALATQWPLLAAHMHCIDFFTPRTFRRFTGHCNGAIYGSPDKLRDFSSGIENLQIAGTDQGLLGIVGAMLSGVLAANNTLLQ